MTSLASDVYGRNPSPKRVRSMIGSAPRAASPTRVSTGIVGNVTPPRAVTPSATIARLPITTGHCSYVGQSFRFASCECMCHFAEPGTTESCDRAWLSGTTTCSGNS